MAANALDSLLTAYQDASSAAAFIDVMGDEEHANVTTAWTSEDDVAYACLRVPKEYTEKLGIDKPNELTVKPVASAKCNDGFYRVVIAFRNKVKPGQTIVSGDKKKE